MAIWDTIKDIRIKAGKTQRQFGDMLGSVTKTHICHIERPYEQTRITASESLLKKIAKTFAKTKEAQLALEKQLLSERQELLIGKLGISSEVIDRVRREHFLKNKGVLPCGAPMPEEIIPPEFAARMRKDIKNKQHILSEQQQAMINKALQGQCFLSRKCVIEIASILKQPIHEYLLLANHLPEDMKNLVEHRGAAAMFRTLGNLNAGEMDKVLDVISDVLKDFKSKKRKSP